MSGADEIWNSLFGGMNGFNKRIEDLFNMMEMTGSDVKTYGYTIWQGADGVPHVKEYGNSGYRIGLPESREPFTDITEEDSVIRVVAEIPGVNKQDIELSCTRNALTIRATTSGREFEKSLALPCDIDADSAKAEYNNGLLEVTLDKVSPSEESKKIAIE